MRKGQHTRPQNICACGCGELVPIYYYKGRVTQYRKFVSGHGYKDWGKRLSALPSGARDRYPIGSTRLHHPRPNLIYRLIKTEKGNVRWRYEHRVVMELHLQRKLLTSEHVHHKNHNTLDNRIENLVVMSGSEHAKHHNLLDRWSKAFECCQECGTTEREHEGVGL